MADPLLSVTTAAQHLRLLTPVTDSDLLADLDQKIAAASDLVRERVSSSLDDSDEIAAVDAWTAADVPADVKAAVLAQLGELWRFRGDDEQLPAGDGYRLSPQVERYLIRRVTPTLA